MRRIICPIKLENFLKTELKILNIQFILDHRNELIKKAAHRFYRKTDYYSRRNIVRLIKNRQLTSILEEFKPQENPTVQTPKTDENTTRQQPLQNETSNPKAEEIKNEPFEVNRTFNFRLSTRKKTSSTKKVSTLQPVKVNRSCKKTVKNRADKKVVLNDVPTLIEQTEFFEPYDILKSVNLIKSTDLTLIKHKGSKFNVKQLHDFFPSIKRENSTFNSNDECSGEDRYQPKYCDKQQFNKTISMEVNEHNYPLEPCEEKLRSCDTVRDNNIGDSMKH